MSDTNYTYMKRNLEILPARLRNLPPSRPGRPGPHLPHHLPHTLAIAQPHSRVHIPGLPTQRLPRGGARAGGAPQDAMHRRDLCYAAVTAASIRVTAVMLCRHACATPRTIAAIAAPLPRWPRGPGSPLSPRSAAALCSSLTPPPSQPPPPATPHPLTPPHPPLPTRCPEGPPRRRPPTPPPPPNERTCPRPTLTGPCC